MDMDGVLIDSEPLWERAGKIGLLQHGIEISHEQYYETIGMRTREWLEHWYRVFNIENPDVARDEDLIVEAIIDLVRKEGLIMPGVREFLQRAKDMGLKIGLATSSPLSLADVVVNILDLDPFFDTVMSGAQLNLGKPHPQVYIDCARQLNSDPVSCACVEDSFNGMIAAKAAKMKCLVVPAPMHFERKEWGAADFVARSLTNVPEAFFGMFKSR